MISGDSGGVGSLGLGLGDLCGGVGTLLRGLTRVEVGETRADTAARLTRMEIGFWLNQCVGPFLVHRITVIEK